MTKKLIYFVFAALIVAGTSTVTSCKKGENDPFISLRSRKARITGEWKLKEGIQTGSSTINGATTTTTTTYTSSTCSSNGSTFQYSETLTIEKDGTYSIDYVEDGFAYTVSGVWFFAGKIKDLDLKNKESLIMNPQSYSEPGYSETYDGLFSGNVLIIDQLKNKEIVFKGEYSSSGTGGFSNSSSYDMTYEKQ